MQTKEIITAKNGERVLIITSYSDTRCVLDSYKLGGQDGGIVAALLGTPAPFQKDELHERKEAFKIASLAKLEGRGA